MATQTSLSKDDILEAIGNMSVFDLGELIEAFKTRFNVTIAAPVAAPAGGAGAAGGAGGRATPGSAVGDDMRGFATLLLASTSPSVDPGPVSGPGAGAFRICLRF